MRRALALALALSMLSPSSVLSADGRAEGRQLYADHPEWRSASGCTTWTPTSCWSRRSTARKCINPQNGGLELGDVPHSWAAAELISLLRDMVVSKQDGWLEVNSGIPDSWLEPGQHVALRNAPTEYGLVHVSLVRRATDLTVQLDGDPPLGWRVRVPGVPAQISVDDRVLTWPAPAGLELPGGSHVVTMRFTR